MRLNYIIKLLFVLISCKLYSQSYIILDSITKEPISFVTVKFGSNNGLYTNEKGLFSLNDKVKDSINISCLGYVNFKESISKLKDTIYLAPKVETLNEVIISAKKSKSLLIGSLKKSENFSALIAPNNEFVTFIKPNKTFENFYLDAIHIPVKKYFPFRQKNNAFENTVGVCRINIYSIDNELPKDKIYSSVPIKFQMDEKETIVVDVSNQLLTLTKEGLYIGIELMGYLDENGNFNDDKNGSYLRIPFTNNITNDFESNTYYKYIFNDKDILAPYNDILKKAGIKKELYIKIGLTISH